MYSIYILQIMYPQYYIGKMSSKILWSQNRNSGAKNIILYLYYEYKLFYFIILFVLKKHDNMQLVLPAWHGLRTGLIWTVNKNGGMNKRKSPGI